MVASPIGHLHINACKRPVAVYTQVRAYLPPSLTGIGHMNPTCHSFMTQVDLCACSIRVPICQGYNQETGLTCLDII